MSFSFASHCLPLPPFSHNGREPLPLGQESLLCVLLIQSGQCVLAAPPGEDRADSGPSLTALAGDVLVFAGTAALLPVGECSVQGLLLQGGAPGDYAAQLTAPLLLQGLAGVLSPLLGQLAQPESKLPASEASALAYQLLCRVVAAGQESAALSPLVLAAMEEMREHYAEVYGVEELAAGLQVSKCHLIRCFTAELGVPPGRYLTAVRVENAKRLLLAGEYSLDVIASLCGFSGANYLCKVFKKHSGETPTAWRSRMSPTLRPTRTSEWEAQLYL